MLHLIYGSLCLMVWGFAGVLGAFPYQQGLYSTSNTEQQRDLRSDVNAGPTEFFTPKPPKYYECFGTNICETGAEFCNERQRRCEKCSDYQTVCGTNFQNPNCTQYCMKVLVEAKCNETVIAKPSPTTTDYTQKTSSSALIDNPETCFNWVWIYVTCTLVIFLATSLSCNIYQYCRSKQAKQTKCTNEEQTKLLKDQLTDVIVDTPISLGSISDQKTSACPKEDEIRLHSLMPSAPLIENENLDQEETSIKSHNKCLPHQEPEDVEPNLCREHQADHRDIMDESQGLEVNADMNTSSGCSSASSTLSRTSAGVTSKTTIFSVNVNIHNGQTSTTPTGTKKNYIQPEIPRKEVPYSVEETDADFNRGKLVSDEDENGGLALPNILVGINDLKKNLFNG